MAEITYLDFDLLIERSGEGYRARVLNSPAGQGAADFSLPFSEMELENFLLRVGRPRRGVRRLESPEMGAAKSLGGRLFNAVFGGEVRGCLRSSLDEASRQGAGLRIRLRLAETPELADLPWEYLYNPALNRFLVLSVETPLVRYLNLPERIRPLGVKPPLRVLVMISSPSDHPPLDVELEWARLKEALGDLEQRGLVALERMGEATLVTLQRRLRREEYHIFHFIGHGGFDERAQDGILLLEDEARWGCPVSGQYLGTLLHDERTLRLAVLNACEGARTSRTDPFAGTAQSLVQQGIPAVIAMRFEITDKAAITLAHEFYAALADGYPVDSALAEARKAIFAQGNDVEWGKPVLYLRSPDGCIFDVKRVSEEERKSTQVAILYREARAAMAREDWTTAIEKLQAVLALHPTHAEAMARLSQARKQQDLASLYARGRKHYEAGRWRQAMEYFRRVQEIGGDYKGVKALIATAERETARKEAIPAPPPAPSLSRWLWVSIAAALMLLLGGALMFTSILKPTPTPAQAAYRPTTVPTLVTSTGTSAPTPTTVPRVEPVAPDEYMVLVAQLESLGAEDRDVARFIVDNLVQALEVEVPFSKIRIREYPEIITSDEAALAAAEANGATVMVWGNYAQDFIELEVQLGVTKAFPLIQIRRETLERTANVRVRMADERRESVAPQVLSVLLVLQNADGNGYEIVRTLAIFDEIEVTSAEVVGDSVAAHAHRAYASYFSGTPHAIEEIDAALALDAGNPLLYVYRSAARQRQGLYDDARRDAQTASRLGPDQWTTPLYLLGNDAFFLGNLDEAISYYSRVIGLRPDDWFPINFQGSLHYLKGEYDLAKVDYERAIALGPNANFPYVFSTMLALREGCMADAAALMNTVLTDFPDPTFANRIVQGIYGDETPIIFGPTFSAFANLILGQYDDVVRDIEVALAINDQFADLYFMRGFAYCNLKDYAAAEAAYTRGLELDPDFTVLYLLRAEVRLEQNNFAGATEDLGAVRNSELGGAFAESIEAALAGELGCESLFQR